MIENFRVGFSQAIRTMIRRRQKIEERLFAERTIALLGESWTIQEPDNEIEWPDLLIKTAIGSFGLEIRKLYADEVSKGSLKRAGESRRARLLKQAAALYYEGGAPPAQVQFYGQPDDPITLANDLATMIPSMQVWEGRKVSYDSQRWMHVYRLPVEYGEYSRWHIVSDSVGWVGVIDISVVQRAIQEKSTRLTRYKRHLDDVRLLLVCDRTMNSGKQIFGNLSGIENAGFNYIYLLSFPDQLIKVPAPKGAPIDGHSSSWPATAERKNSV